MVNGAIPGELLNRIARFGRLYLLDTVTSTNDYAFSLTSRNEPAIVVARKQTHGRGRFRRRWFSDEKSLTFSLLLFPDREKPAAFSAAALTQLAGLALCRAIENRFVNPANTPTPRPLLRWPNDVLVQEKKVAGILCEKRGNGLVVGIGVNVNQTELPAHLTEAGSLYSIYRTTLNPLELLEEFLKEFFSGLELLKRADPGIWNEIRARSVILNHRVEIRTLLRRHTGTAIDIDDAGRLVLRTDSGRLALFTAGQVRQLR